MKIKTTITEALIIVLISALLALIYGLVSPNGRILLKKGLRIKTGTGASPAIMALRRGP